MPGAQKTPYLMRQNRIRFARVVNHNKYDKLVARSGLACPLDDLLTARKNTVRDDEQELNGLAL